VGRRQWSLAPKFGLDRRCRAKGEKKALTRLHPGLIPLSLGLVGAGLLLVVVDVLLLAELGPAGLLARLVHEVVEVVGRAPDAEAAGARLQGDSAPYAPGVDARVARRDEPTGPPVVPLGALEGTLGGRGRGQGRGRRARLVHVVTLVGQLRGQDRELGREYHWVLGGEAALGVEDDGEVRAAAQEQSAAKADLGW
jgi:hypothetical protein